MDNKVIVAKANKDLETDQLEALELKSIHTLGEEVRSNYRVYLPLFNQTIIDQRTREQKTLSLPMVLGTGRNAVVFLGVATRAKNKAGQEYFAVKCLKKDVDSEYAKIALTRFFDEMRKSENFGHYIDFFVIFNSRGAIGWPENSAEGMQWMNHIGPELEHKKNDSLKHLEVRDYYRLQGPFYVLDLCYATLYDLLDRDINWLKLPAYEHMKRLVHQSEERLGTQQRGDISRDIEESASRITEQIKEIARYFENDDFNFTGKSGYDILNSFKKEPDANMVRNYTVLDLFKKVAKTISQLHNSQHDKLTHRDLKPGNLFVKHALNAGGIIDKIEIRLADLGFVTDRGTLVTGDWSLDRGSQSPMATVPGSQFYRAPEQAELPIEVQVSFDPTNRKEVRVKSSKISNIQKGDKLIIGDAFRASSDHSKENEPRVNFQIDGVIYDEDNKSIVGFKLSEELNIDNTKDIVAHVVRATGFHTDGYSLGAMLYDLASGGRNPEIFYTYCLVRFIKEFSGRSYTIEQVVEALCPTGFGLNSGSKRLQNSSADKQAVATSSPPIARWQARSDFTSVEVKSYLALDNWDTLLPSAERKAFNAHIKTATDLETLLQQFFSSNLEQKLQSLPPEYHNYFTGDTLSLAEKWQIVKEVILLSGNAENLIGRLINKPSIRQKIDRLAPSTSIDQLTVREKWNLLKLVMDSYRLETLLKTLANSADLNELVEQSKPNERIQGISFKKKWDYFKILMEAENDVDQLIENILESSLDYNRTDLNEALNNYKFRKFHIVDEYLTDKRGVPIPREIIEIIVKCMLRNAEGSYYQNTDSPLEGYFSVFNVEASNQIFKDTEDLLTREEYLLPKNFPETLKEDLLFKLRAMAPLIAMAQDKAVKL